MMASTAASAVATTLSVEQAVACAVRGEHAGWDWLFTRYYRLVLRYCTARIGDREHAQDAVQEVFVAAVGTLDRLRDRSESGVEGWLLGIARHKCVDRIRTLVRDRGGDTGGAPQPDAAEIAVDRLTAAGVRAALEKLSEEQREVIIRRFLMDQSLETVASATRRPVGAVKSMQHRALIQLAKHCRGIER